MLSSFIFVMVFCNIANCWVSIEKTPSEMRLPPGVCYGSQGNIGRIRSGFPKNVPNQCVRASCFRSGLIEYEGCLAMDAVPPCKIYSEHPRAPYPKCCPRVTCPLK